MGTVSPLRCTSATMLGLSLALAACLAGAAEGLPENVQIAYCSQTLNTLSLSPSIDVATVAKVKFFITADGGKTWVLGQETIQPPTIRERPRFPFKVDHDGIYGVMTCVTFRDGRAEVEPRPGQAPQYALVIDTMPPVIARFDVKLVGTSSRRCVVQVAWSSSDANPSNEPIALEACSDGTGHFTVVRRGPAEGTSELTIPLDPLTKQIQLRLVATDRAGNSSTSPVRTLAVAPPASEAAVPKPVASTAPAATPAPATPDTAPAAPAPSATAPTPVATVPATVSPAAAAEPLAPAPAAAPAPTPDAVSEFVQAAKGLPTLSDIVAAPQPPLPEIPPVAQDRHSPGRPAPAAPPAPATPAPVATQPAAATPAPSAQAAPPSGGQPDVVIAAVPQGREPGAVDAPATTPIPGSNAVDQEVYDSLTRNEPTYQPHQLRRPLPGSDEPTSMADPHHPRALEPGASAAITPSAPAPAPPRQAAARSAPLAPARLSEPDSGNGDGQHSPAMAATYVPDDQALHTLGLARIAVRGPRFDDGLDLYESLFASSQARTAAAEELQALTRAKRPLDALIVIDALPRELLVDAVRLEHGRALISLKRYDQAFATLTRIGSRSPESREALFMLATCYRAKGQPGEARKLLEFLARGSDRFAEQAAAQLGHPAP